jgi:spermidine/putrescine transport system ATP-binding protein
MLAMVRMSDYRLRFPRELSGGQQQRVALARAIVNKPDVLLLDEPLGALDLKLRRQMQLELKRIQTEVGLTFVHVTHDQEEAMTMADTIAVMNCGRIEQLGSPVELYESPATAYVANFLGQSNLVRAAVRERSADRVCFEVGGQLLSMPAGRCRSTSDEILAGVRPEKIHLVRERAGTVVEPPAGLANRLGGGVVTDASFTGVSTQYLVRLAPDLELMVFAQNRGIADVLPVGEQVALYWEPAHTFGLDGAQDASAGAGVDDEPVAVG